MKKSVAEKWVKALRSGKYKKGPGALQSQGEYCCLGVLCEVVGLVPQEREFGVIRYDDQSSVLPYSAMKLSGMKTDNGEMPVPKYGANSLITLNDHKAKSFRMIANYIEKHWKDL